MVRIGSMKLVAYALPLPRNRTEVKRILRAIAKKFGVDQVYFVKSKHAEYSGRYKIKSERIIIVEQKKSKPVPIDKLVFTFFHELTHHLDRQAGLFSAYYQREDKVLRRRVALRAEKHANRKACELSEEFFGICFPKVPEYPKDDLWRIQGFNNS